MRAPARDDRSDRSASQFGCKLRNSIKSILGSSGIGSIAALSPSTGVLQALTKSAQTLRQRIGRSRVKEPDHRHRRLLRPRAASGNAVLHPDSMKFPPPHVRPQGSGRAIVAVHPSILKGADVRFGSFASIWPVYRMSALPPIATEKRTSPNWSLSAISGHRPTSMLAAVTQRNAELNCLLAQCSDRALHHLRNSSDRRFRF